MKRKYFIFLFCYFLLLQAKAQAPDWVWAKVAQSSVGGVSENTGIAVDNTANVYITGWYGGTVTFGAFSLSSNTGAYLVKYDSNGNVLWAKGSSGGQAEGLGITTDEVGNIYVTGTFQASILFGSYLLSSVGYFDVFIVKYDPNGNVLWAKSGGGLKTDQGFSLTTDHLNNLYVTGQNQSGLFVMGSDTITNQGIFIAKFDSTGNELWLKSVAGSDGYNIASDLSNNVYIAGDSDIKVVLMKYDFTGNQLWYKTATSGEGRWVATDGSDNVYFTGWYNSSSIKFGSKTLTNAGGNDAFFVKYDSSGNVLWAKSIGGLGDEEGWGVTTDKNKNVYLAGGFTSDSLKLDTINILQPPGSIDPTFFAGYDTSGKIFFVKDLPSGGDDNILVVPSSSCLYVGGDFAQTVIVVGKDTLVSGYGIENAFVAKLCYESLSAGFSSSDTNICNESCIKFYDNSTGFPTAWQWSFPGAAPSSSSQQNPTNICYTDIGYHNVTLIVSSGGGSDTVKLTNFIRVLAVPPTPIITQSGDTLISTIDSTYIFYQWYSDSVLIPNATNYYYVIQHNGNYNLSVKNENGCSTSAGIIVLGIDNVNVNSFNIYPNPATNQLILTGLTSHGGMKTLQVFNILGMKLYEDKVDESDAIIDVTNFSQGVYYIRLEANGERLVRKFIKE